MTASPAPLDQDWSHLRAQVRRMLGTRLANAADAEDVVQEVLLRVLRGAGGLQDGERFGAWLWTTVRNAVTDQQRARQRHPLASGEADDQTAPEEEEEEKEEESGGARARVAQALRPFAQRLPAIYREVIILSELEEVPHAEIARRLHISVSGVKARVRRGRQQLHDLLNDCCEISLDARQAIVECVPRSGATPPTCCPPQSGGPAP